MRRHSCGATSEFRPRDDRLPLALAEELGEIDLQPVATVSFFSKLELIHESGGAALGTSGSCAGRGSDSHGSGAFLATCTQHLRAQQASIERAESPSEAAI
jgi:hypothetical protein